MFKWSLTQSPIDSISLKLKFQSTFKRVTLYTTTYCLHKLLESHSHTHSIHSNLQRGSSWFPRLPPVAQPSSRNGASIMSQSAIISPSVSLTQMSWVTGALPGKNSKIGAFLWVFGPVGPWSIRDSCRLAYMLPALHTVASHCICQGQVCIQSVNKLPVYFQIKPLECRQSHCYYWGSTEGSETFLCIWKITSLKFLSTNNKMVCSARPK